MKKSIKKLRLSRETIQRLEGPDMTRVAGGLSDAVGLSCPTSCACRTSNGPYTCLCPVPSTA